ncbi:hypothetical protein D1631_04645 [Chryseobacterium nematophagum]|uniref:DUF4292 domain-containing protein n=1 Tax=Chryseobacterium nematophagum TaxID=2305228 RepID=A0A3M7TF66_9FLAO|nr:hypothetical protein [Chryseobacterium nematophagum]RNA61279.1 hypothetical protein D1631_04645 [Chryseobacterium nematophagum]
MPRFLLQSFLYSGILLLFVGCRSYQLTEAKPVSNTKKIVENLYFSSSQDYVYKCQIDIYKHHVSGILIIKKLNDSTHRVALTSDFGNKLIDFEISQDRFKINYILPDLNKKVIRNFFKNDFQQLLKKEYPISESFEQATTSIYLSKSENKKYYLFLSKENHLLNKIIYTKNNKEKIDFTFDSKKHNFADSIHLQHRDFKINIKLYQITETE